jgi:hypothetical protein
MKLNLLGARPPGFENIYDRFIKKPAIISACASALMFSTIFLSLFIMGESFWGGVSFVIFSGVGALSAFMFRPWLKAKLYQGKLRAWLLPKFNGSWVLACEWMAMTPGYVINQAAGLPDGSWVPNKRGGGIQTDTHEL